jgi:hypothetical protein
MAMGHLERYGLWPIRAHASGQFQWTRSVDCNREVPFATHVPLTRRISLIQTNQKHHKIVNYKGLINRNKLSTA